MRRRDFLNNTVKLGAAYSLAQLFPNLSWAQTSDLSNKKLLVIRFNGAWDPLMAMDAYKRETLNDFKFSDSEFLSFDSRSAVKPFAHGFLAPAMEPLFPHLNDLCIVNGILMNIDSSTHETNREYMAGGNSEKSVPFFPFALASALPGQNYKVAYRMEYEQLRDGNYANKMQTGSIQSYMNTTQDTFESFLSDDDETAQLQKNVIRQKQSQKNSIEILSKIIQNAEKKFNLSDEGFRHCIHAVAGLGSGILGAAQVDTISDPDLDTHYGHAQRQTSTLTRGFSFLSQLINFMKETPYLLDPTTKLSLFDVTTVVVTSEFSRTSWREGLDGTSHNQYNNSCMLFGSKVNGGTMIGGSYIYKKNEHKVFAHPTVYKAAGYDFKKQTLLSKEETAALSLDNIGSCSENTCYDFIYPETIWRTVARQYKLGSLDSLPGGPHLEKMFKRS